MVTFKDKLVIMCRLWLWLNANEHKLGLEAKINHDGQGKSWFIVQPTYTYFDHEVFVNLEKPGNESMIVTDIYGDKYVRVNAGEQKGKFILVESRQQREAQKAIREDCF